VTPSAAFAGALASQWGSWALVLARVGGFAWVAPAFSSGALGWRIRVGLCVLLTAALGPVVVTGVAAPADLPALGRACLVECFAGAALGWLAALIVAGARQAGELVGLQAGLSPSALIDPETSEEMNALGHLYGLLALDGPLGLLGALVDSYRVLPAGRLGLTPEAATWAFGQVGEALALALRLAAPCALALILAGLALGLLSRASPAFQLAGLSLPGRSVVGLVLVFLGLASLGLTLAAAWSRLPALPPFLVR
jgi:flagellar biosynthesis protein FliR